MIKMDESRNESYKKEVKKKYIIKVK